MREKTVYVLGAGFSAPAGAPDQARLIEGIFALREDDFKTKEAKRALEKFLVEVMHVDPTSKSSVTLEDIYTPIDRCLANGVSFRDRTPSQLRELRGQMEFLISAAVERAFTRKAAESPSACEYVNTFARSLVEIASGRAHRASGEATPANDPKTYDPFSIISLNWDIVLDKALFKALEVKDAGVTDDYAPIGVVDYCCYISSLEERAPRIRPGLWALGAKGYNVKLLKIHGSMNWLQCSNCQRLFVSFDEKENVPNFINARICRHCSQYDVGAILQGSLVMPTFLKDLNNFQIKLVWQNAALELMEATRLVFIGYSLPHADFEFRQLLTRMVNKNASIHVVLYNSKTPDGERQYNEECRRYRQFFSGRTLTFEPDGVLAFVNHLFSCNA